MRSSIFIPLLCFNGAHGLKIILAEFLFEYLQNHKHIKYLGIRHTNQRPERFFDVTSFLGNELLLISVRLRKLLQVSFISYLI